MIHRIHYRGGLTGILMLTGVLGFWGCSRNSEKPPAKTQPSAVVEDEPIRPEPPSPDTQPATEPATQPAADPACTYDPDPPYTVDLFVRRPEQEQPGWLSIKALSDPDTPATATGEFPRQNHVYIETGNVHQMEIDVEFLPLGPRNSVILHLDRQVIEVFRRPDRQKLIMERRPTGEWVLLRRSG